MFIDIFGPRAKPCGDCIEFGDIWYCTMNCSSHVPPEVSMTPSDRKNLESIVRVLKGAQKSLWNISYAPRFTHYEEVRAMSDKLGEIAETYKEKLNA